jgi:hypothetical protein
MKISFKSLSFTFLLATILAAFTMPAAAQSYSQKEFSQFVTVGSAATNVALVISCEKQKSVPLQWLRQSSGTTASAIGIAYSRSVDKKKWDTTWEVLSLAGGGATETVTCTNIPTYGFGYIKIHYATNANAGTVYTTNTIKWAANTAAP